MIAGATRHATTVLPGLVAVFALFQWAAASLGSDRGQAGLLVGALVLIATLFVERTWFARTFVDAAHALGLGPPRVRGLVVCGLISLLLLLTIPAFILVTGTSLNFYPAWFWLVPGLFAQAGIAEEVLFRGYLFGHLRRGRSFWRAAVLAAIPFVVVHLWLFATMEWPIAAAAVVLAVILSFPLAHLYGLGGETIWPPAVLHFVVQGAAKIFIISGDAVVPFPIAWMAASMAVSMLVFLARRPLPPL